MISDFEVPNTILYPLYQPILESILPILGSILPILMAGIDDTDNKSHYDTDLEILNHRLKHPRP